MTDEEELSVEGFAERFEGEARDPCQLYLISPQEVGGGFPDQLRAALAGGPVAAFQLRVKNVERFVGRAV